MSNSTEFLSEPLKAFNIPQVDFLEAELTRTHAEQAAQIASLRAYNTELLEQITELKKSDVDHASFEKMVTEVKAQLAAEQAKSRELQHGHLLEIESMQETNSALHIQMRQVQAEKTDIETEFEQAKQSLEEELKANKEKFEAELIQTRENLEAALKDSKEALESEIEGLKQAHESQIATFKEDQRNLIHSYEQKLSDLNREMQTVKDQAAKAWQSFNHQSAQAMEAFRVRESQLQAEIAKLRVDIPNLEKNLKEAHQVVSDQHKALEKLQSEARRCMQDLRVSMHTDFQKQSADLVADNEKLRQLLNVRDTQNEAERNNLKQWKEQLSYLDQHLELAKGTLKRERGTILKLAKQLMSELQAASVQPYAEYLQVAETEIIRIQGQVEATPAMSPMRKKLEERLAQVIEQRDFMADTLNQAHSQLNERLESLDVIVKSVAPAIS